MPGNIVHNQIGNFGDLVPVPYIEDVSTMYGFLHTGYYHVHGRPLVYPDKANNIVLTSGAAAWSETGALVEVVPANALNVADFDLHWVNIAAISTNAEIQIDIYAGLGGSEVKIGSTRSQRNTNQSRENANRIQIAQQPVNTRITARLLDSTSGAITTAISLEGHYYTM